MIEQSMTELASHFRRLAKDHPSDFRRRIRSELAGCRLPVTELLFVSSALGAALHDHVQSLSESADIQGCGFCGKKQLEVRVLVQGPMSCICNECVDICKEILEVRGDASEPA